MNVKEIFLQAVEIKDRQAKLDFVEDQCAGDERLKTRIYGLLAADEQPWELLDKPLVSYRGTQSLFAIIEKAMRYRPACNQPAEMCAKDSSGRFGEV
jgi:hypothetical protein